MSLPPAPAAAAVRLVEVGPRDGLQNITQVVPTDLKIELVQRLSATGLTTIETTSFVSPKWIPQLADGSSVLNALSPLIRANPSKKFPVLVPNVKGLRRAIENGAKEVAVFVSASEGFSRKNTNCSINEALDRAREVSREAAPHGVLVRGYISCIFACPYDGPTSPEAVLRVAQALLDAGCYEISLGDTLGVGTPADVQRLLNVLLQKLPVERLAGHYHDTYGQAVANVIRSYELGIRVFDSSVAGLGGCPYARGALGNLATEDIVYMFEKMGVATGVDLDKLVETGVWISQKLGQQNQSRAGKALHTKKSAAAAPPPSQQPVAKYTWTHVQSTEEYRLARSGPNAKLTLTRPRKGNMLSATLVRDLTLAFQKLSADASISRIILTGEGKYFCTGMDLSSSASSPSDTFAALTRLFAAIDAAPQTTLALINGPCFGGGVGLALACDVRLAVRTATFTLSEVKLGLAPAVISPYVLRELGPSFAREMMLTGRSVPAAELRGIGALHALAEKAEDLDSVLEGYLDRLRGSAPGGAALCKELVRVAWTGAGGEKQAERVKASWDAMMGGSAEAEHGMRLFRNGVKGVDWDAWGQERQERQRSKL